MDNDLAGGTGANTTDVRSEVSVGAEGAADRVRGAVEDAKDRAGDLAGQAKDKAQDLGQRASEAASQARQRVGEVASQAREKASAALHSAESTLEQNTGLIGTIRSNPLPALGIAVGLGIVLAGSDDSAYKSRGARGQARRELRNAVMAGLSTVAANEVRSLMNAGGTKGMAGGLLNQLLDNLRSGGTGNAFRGMGDALKDAVKSAGGSGGGSGSSSGGSAGGGSGAGYSGGSAGGATGAGSGGAGGSSYGTGSSGSAGSYGTGASGSY